MRTVCDYRGRGLAGSFPFSRRDTKRGSLGALFVLVACGPLVGQTRPADADGPADTPRIVTCRKIWDAAPHNAFTDLVRFRDRWFCTFREGRDHAGGDDGRLRVIVSDDGDAWESAALLAEEGVDLRDPKLSVTADGRLMMVAGGSIYRDGKFVTRRSRVAFSADGCTWTPPRPVLPEKHWLWRVAWHEGIAYGVSYYPLNETGSERGVTLWASRDGVEYDALGAFEIPGAPCETTLRFDEDGRMIALVRRVGRAPNAYVGVSEKPYHAWQWKELGEPVGGPNFLILPDGAMWAAGRRTLQKAETVLARLTLDSYEPVLTLPSGGDTSYPGMVMHEGLLWMSYYSSHEGKTSIYLAKIRLP